MFQATCTTNSTDLEQGFATEVLNSPGAACMGARLCIAVGTPSCCRGAAMQTLTCFGGQILGDFIAQAATTGGFAAVGFDWHRSIALSSFAAIIGGVQSRRLWCSAHHSDAFCRLSRCQWQTRAGSVPHAGPTGHFWHRFLEKRVCKNSPKSNQAVFTKLALDQVQPIS